MDGLTNGSTDKASNNVVTENTLGKSNFNKAGYTAIQSRMVTQEQQCENRSKSKKHVGQTNRHGKACPRLKMNSGSFEGLFKEEIIQPGCIGGIVGGQFNSLLDITIQMENLS